MQALRLSAKRLRSRGRLHKQNCYSYLSPIDKPVYPLALNSLIESSAELMQYSFLESGGAISPELSVLSGALVFRFLVEGVSVAIRSLQFKEQRKNVDYFEDDNVSRPLLKWINKIFIVDSVKDYEFYGMPKDIINRMIALHYQPGAMLASAANIYLCLQFFRGCNLLITSPEFAAFCESSAYLPNLVLYDPNFATPIIAIFITFLILKRSRHPLLIHLSQRQNILHCFNIAFMAGLLLVPVPGIYHFAYFGLAIGHLMVRPFRYFQYDLGRMISNLKGKHKRYK